jgi:uncharacterized membrane protein required for colicin V production
MTWNLTLDILLVVLVLLFAPIGFMRGPVKELLVTLGVVFGALMVEFWARPWGRDLDFYFDIGDDAGAFVVAMAFLMGTTFIGGYGLGLLLAPWTYSIRGRAAGALTSALNGALLVSFSLQYVRLFLLSDANEEALEESYSVGFLMNEVGWIMLAAVVLLPAVIVYALITRRRAYDLQIWDDYDEEYYDDYDAAYDYLDDDRLAADAASSFAPSTAGASHMAETRVMPPRVPGGVHSEGPDYKAEPEPIPFRPSEATRPITVSDFEHETGGGRGHTSGSPQAEWFAIGDTDPSMERLDTTDLAPFPPPERDVEQEVERAEEDRLPEGYTRCEACHAVLPPNVGICPVCGHAH